MTLPQSMPEVSVIIPCYNHGHYLRAALSSVLRQTWTNWEVVVVDDGSTDDTAIAARDFDDPRIHYTYQTNQGLSAARNTGIQVSVSALLSFLDADDEWEPEFLERCVETLRKDLSLGAVYAIARFIDESGNLLPQGGSGVVADIHLYRRLLEGNIWPVHAALVRREAVEQAGLFDTALTSVEDWDLWLKIAQRWPIAGIPEELVRYRVIPGSMSADAERMYANRMQVLSNQLGPLDGEPSTWTEAKRRAHAFAIRAAAIEYAQQGNTETSWKYLAQAAALCPELLDRIDTFFDLACAHQPKGYRGTARLLDSDRAEREVLEGLEAMFDSRDENRVPSRRTALANAHLALWTLNERVGDWSTARRHLLMATRSYPMLLKDRKQWLKLLRLSLGQRFTRALRAGLRPIRL